jgi:formylmethanofuran dehydrogenase subunit E
MIEVEAPAAAPIWARAVDDLLAEAVSFHGHLCPGQVLGVRMTIAGCRETGFAQPRVAGKRLVVFVEIDRCATDAVQALTGVSLGKRTLKHLDWGKTAATFVDARSGRGVRVAARDDARELARLLVPGEPDPRRAQTAAYRVMPERSLLLVESVVVAPGWLDRPRVRVRCAECREDVNYGREVVAGGRVLCGGCAGERYYAYDHRHTASGGPGPIMRPHEDAAR